MPSLSTKAETLLSLRDCVKASRVLPCRFFTVQAWSEDQNRLVDDILSAFPGQSLIVRSSAANEDSLTESKAGAYKSCLDICGEQALRAAIDEVIESYQSDNADSDLVLVQPMLDHVTVSGVAFTHDPATGAPYKIINYVSGHDTTAVTSGTKNTSMFVYTAGAQSVPDKLASVKAMIDELENLFPGQPLDIEFALQENDENDLPVLLQVRPLILNKEAIDHDAHKSLLERLHTKIRQAQKPHPFLRGHSTVFGVMPDWNPAEIIGIRPRPLALSLYKELVTDSIWAYQRHNYGYRNLRSFPLIVSFAGLPYVDVRLSFNSFIPAGVESSLADRLVDYYIDTLNASPKLHDKIEFEIVLSCYTLDLPTRMKMLKDAGFTDREQAALTEGLRTLTNNVIDHDSGLWRQDARKVEILSQRREEIMAADMDDISKIYWLLEDCKRYGTLPFAGLARAGFIAVQMLKSLVTVGIFTQEDYDSFMTGLNTVSSQLSRDLSSMERTSFLSRYGHLRPGTYDICSKRYDEAPDDYLGKPQTSAQANENRKPFKLSLEQMNRISRLLEEHGLSSDVVKLFDFLQSGIEMREYSKFTFTRNLSDALSLFKAWGQRLGFSEDDLSHANIHCIYELYSCAHDPKQILENSISEGKKRYAETCRIWLPPLITDADDVFAFEQMEAEPNFITQGNVTAPVTTPDNTAHLEGAIVFIPSADPGYDWLFSYKIGGLVTAYGGANSHMAIRANELNLPAVIGAGEVLYERWAKAQKIHIDCACRRVEILS
ncbi:MAG: phosphoenolpyruvate synthase [Alphaproteobacteria bacterium]|nr:phosphoenolpyruvate synthase [Alphaproteobacteria bacterium]